MTFMSKNGRTKSYYCTRRAARGSAACTNAKGIPEAKLDAAVLGALHKVVKDPATAWALIQERTERWRQEQALSVDVRTNLEREEKKSEAAIERLLDNMEAGADVGLRLKTRRAELDALRVRLASDGAIVQADEEAFERMLLERAEHLRKHHGHARPRHRQCGSHAHVGGLDVRGRRQPRWPGQWGCNKGISPLPPTT